MTPDDGRGSTFLIRIRPTAPDDQPEVLRVVREAFTSEERDGHEETAIVAETWRRGASPPGLDLVAVEGDVIVGHVMAGIGQLDGRTAVGLAPLSVVPSRQGRGIGSLLMAELLQRVEAAGWLLIVLLGDPDYYWRFGFEAAAPLGIVYRPVGAESEAFQVRRLSGYDDSWRGEFTYCWELPQSPTRTPNVG